MKIKGKPINVILASTRDLGIGFRNDLPWPKLSLDFKIFKNITTNTADSNALSTNSLIYGFKTFESMKFKALPSRFNIVITGKPGHTLTNYQQPNIKFLGSIDEAIEFSNSSDNIKKTFVIGGASIFDQLLKDYSKYNIQTLYWTRVFKDFQTDVKLNKEHFNAFLAQLKYSKVSKTVVEHNDINYDFSMFSASPLEPTFPLDVNSSEEYQYLQLLDELIKSGEERPDRTNTGVKGLFGKMMRYDIAHTFPLLTTKSVFFRGVVEELLWFLKGQTNANLLTEKGVGIWDGNGSREFLDSRGLVKNKQGDLGPVYGFQWRHFGAEYLGFEADYGNKGIDQISQLIESLKKDKFSRRHLLSAWNPLDLDKMALPPCHVLSQFYISHEDKLNCALYQRSADIGLGIPFNIASYSLLLCIIADFLGLRRGDFVHFIGDAHVYLNHVEQLQIQIQRIPNAFPLLFINKKSNKLNVWDYEADEIVLKNYFAHNKLKMKMAV